MNLSPLPFTSPAAAWLSIVRGGGVPLELEGPPFSFLARLRSRETWLCLTCKSEEGGGDI